MGIFVDDDVRDASSSFMEFQEREPKNEVSFQQPRESEEEEEERMQRRP